MDLPTVPLKIRRGDNYSFFWKIQMNDGTFFVPNTNDEVIIGVKRNRRAQTYLMKKIYTAEDFSDSGFYFVLSSEDTSNFLPAEYEYDIGLKICTDLENDSYSFYHIINISPFIVLDSITLP